MTTSNMEEKLSIFLKSIGISGRYKGFYYLKEAVFLVLEDEHCLCNIQKEIYRPIAEMYHVSVPSIARAIRTVCQIAAANEAQLRAFFPGFLSHGTLYPKELIEMAADYLRYQ
ncbi:sporulation initiation factor Spo0A C-terminal domain-containing protein [Sellimonas catena]|uniref:Sporulation initiation factor Spo0A C-terminal domain-containing protein n=1 Tax=Sellimonas catena TaxID=2994035 RepID=A0A9W6CFM5_9FIRM|nr:sporulation initiation factor Spo0A C-terminal domain-containing protein [Sellimonas catena]GLG90387.1 hypothetical protein Selli2_18140 [Sellimonas catena]